MANEISTAGIELLYASNNGTNTPPTSGWTKIDNIKSIPEFNAEPSNLEVTDLSDTVWRRYIPGLRDPGGALAFNANFTSSFKSEWETMIEAANGSTLWYAVNVPGFGAFTFTGEPTELGLPSADVDAPFEGSVYIVPNTIHGWGTNVTVGA